MIRDCRWRGQPLLFAFRKNATKRLMIRKNKDAGAAFRAGDGTLLREVLHPEREGLDLTFSVAHARLLPGERSLPHVLRRRDEVYLVIRGHGLMHIGDEAEPIGPGDLVLIPKGARQWVEQRGDEPLEFWAVVGPPWKAEDEVIFDGEGR